MADYPYTTVSGKLSEFLGKIPSWGVPDKVTTKWLPTVGFASNNDRSIIPVLKFVGLLENSGTPSDVWKDFRGAKGGRALGTAIRASYSALFQTYPDAPNRTSDELKAFFRGHSSYGAQAVDKAVATFKVLCQHAEFADEPAKPPSAHQNVLHETPRRAADPPQANAGPELHIDVQIHISPESTNEQIEKIFESMAKHLYRKAE